MCIVETGALIDVNNDWARYFAGIDFFSLASRRRLIELGIAGNYRDWFLVMMGIRTRDVDTSILLVRIRTFLDHVTAYISHM